MLKKFLLNEKIPIQFLFAGLPEVFFGLRLVKRQLNQVTLGAGNGIQTGFKGAERLMTVRNNHVAARPGFELKPPEDNKLPIKQCRLFAGPYIRRLYFLV